MQLNKSKSNSQDRLPFVSVIIPVYNDSERLKICLEAVDNQTYPKARFEIIVVDNGSETDVGPLVAQFDQAVIAYENRTGSYSARNKGLSIAKGEVMAFTDSDCIPAPDWIEKGVANLLRVPNIGLVGGKVECIFTDPRQPTAVEVYDSITYLDQKYWVEVDKFAITANVFTFRNVFDHVGLFNDTLKSGGDMEWGKRVSSSDYKIFYADDTRVSHPARNSFIQQYKKQVRVAGGFQDFKRQNPDLFTTGLARDLLPPMRRILRACSDARIKGSGLKARVIFVTLLLYLVKVYEIIRFRLGGRPARS
jgi:glycosyltransferase involved in cell wall biosynthesis